MTLNTASAISINVSPTLTAAVQARDIAKVIEIIAACKRRSQETETEYLVALNYVEVTIGGDILNFVGALTFEAFLRDHCNVSPARYRDFCTILQRDGEATVTQRGVEASLLTGHVTDPAKLQAINTSINQWKSEHHGVTPSREAAKNIVNSIAPKPAVPNVLKRSYELDQLRAENAQLRADNNALKRQVVKLERENAKLRKAASSSAGSSAAPL